jgi:NAD-dependent dihydropyrimidine dehydrogenase PreA subunit
VQKRDTGRARSPKVYFPADARSERKGPEEKLVAYIICEPCVGTKDTACVDVCPVDCIHPRKDEPDFQTAEMLYIHPDECIDCGACVPACPVEAIFALDETPEKWKSFIPVNSQYFQK